MSDKTLTREELREWLDRPPSRAHWWASNVLRPTPFTADELAEMEGDSTPFAAAPRLMQRWCVEVAPEPEAAASPEDSKDAVTK